VHSGSNHAQKEVGPVVLDSTSEDLLLSGNGRCTLDAAQRVDGCANTQITNTLSNDICVLVRRATPFLSVLYRNLRKTDTDSPNITSKDVSTIESLAGTNSIVKAFKVN
jgi:hypothetical protein